MKVERDTKKQTVYQYNNCVLKSSEILTGKEFRRMKRKRK